MSTIVVIENREQFLKLCTKAVAENLTRLSSDEERYFIELMMLSYDTAIEVVTNGKAEIEL